MNSIVMSHQQHTADKMELFAEDNLCSEEREKKRPLPELGPEYKPCTIEDINAILHGDRDRYEQIMSRE